MNTCVMTEINDALEIPRLNDITLNVIDSFVEKKNLKSGKCNIFDELTSEEYILKGWEAFCSLVDVEKLINGEFKKASEEIADIIILKGGLLNGITQTIQNKDEYKPVAFFYEISLWDGAYHKQSLFTLLFKKHKNITLKDVFDDFMLHLASEDLNSFDRDSYYAILDGKRSVETHLFETFGKDYNLKLDRMYGVGICNEILSYYNSAKRKHQLA